VFFSPFGLRADHEEIEDHDQNDWKQQCFPTCPLWAWGLGKGIGNEKTHGITLKVYAD
jgi:hypothetical protein